MLKVKYSLSPRLARLFRFFGLFIPIILIIYGLLIQYDVIQANHIADITGLFMFLFWWVYLSILQYLAPIKTKLDSVLRLVAFHLLAGSYLIFISGIASPFVGFWLLLMLASYMYYSDRGLQLSTVAFVLFVIIDILIWRNEFTVVRNDLIVLALILITNIAILTISGTKQDNKEELKRAKAQESLQRDRVSTIVNNMTDAVLSTDMQGIIQVYNAASLNLLDTNVNLKGRQIDDIIPLFDADDNKILLSNEFKKAKTVIKRDDLSYKFDDEEKIRLEVTYSPIRSSFSRSLKSDVHDGYIIILRDITKSKSLEEERDEFISVVSHELRTPIAIAEGTIANVQIMLNHTDITKKMLSDAVDTAHDQIMFLSSMVNDLSTLSRAERGVAGNLEDIDVLELAQKLYDKYHDEAKLKNLQLNLDLSPKLGKVRVSRLYLEELLQNFITNSIKYTKKGSVTIVFENKNGTVTFAIKDTGIGISKSDQTKIFNKFYRSEDYRTRETGGTGLGLYIAAKLAHKLGIKIKLVSRLNFGSTFSFTLPEIK